ncbi:hypothetical protein FVE85_8911 [Porphyridium purpureum]|uniref:Uncharacterized protein n=1 Tax=Porphyridium purpureum TaxID=35688 RepID=A0A5J4YIW0_PORPP|nr:hypothetical protein FVE85_8911 [Porphyridium purpureum]|eukprot:POR8075..scf276_29
MCTELLSNWCIQRLRPSYLQLVPERYYRHPKRRPIKLHPRCCALDWIVVMIHVLASLASICLRTSSHVLKHDRILHLRLVYVHNRCNHLCKTEQRWL